MPTSKRFLVAVLAATAGTIALGAYSLINRPHAAYGDLAIVTLIFATAYVITVRRAQQWLGASARVARERRSNGA
jgi:peptidoglycan/LPS O-acetylase OafA/YrhL